MPAGTFFGTLFFLLLTFAALTTSIGLIEPVVAWAEEKWDVTRKKIVFVICFIAWLIGLATVFSFNIWSDVYLLGQFVTFAEKTPFDLIDYFVTYIMQPAGALLLVIFVGWKMSGDILRKELVSISNTMLYTGWLFSVRFIAPLIIVTLFILGIFY
jgi:NSS family neurotransmitter:Na+ symporter